MTVPLAVFPHFENSIGHVIGRATIYRDRLKKRAVPAANDSERVLRPGYELIQLA